MINTAYYERRNLPNNIFPFHDIEKGLCWITN